MQLSSVGLYHRGSRQWCRFVVDFCKWSFSRCRSENVNLSIVCLLVCISWWLILHRTAIPYRSVMYELFTVMWDMRSTESSEHLLLSIMHIHNFSTCDWLRVRIRLWYQADKSRKRMKCHPPGAHVFVGIVSLNYVSLVAIYRKSLRRRDIDVINSIVSDWTRLDIAKDVHPDSSKIQMFQWWSWYLWKCFNS